VSSEGSYKKYCDANAKFVEKKLGIDTEASRCMKENNYARIKGGVPVHVLNLIEEYIETRGDGGRFKKINMFSKVVDDEVKHDNTRQMLDCALDWVLFFLIAAPVTLKLLEHGLLHIAKSVSNLVPSTQMRAARVVTYIVSPERPGKAESKHQAWHEDFASNLAEYFKMQYAISVIVGCMEGSIVHIIPKSYGGDDKDVDKKIEEGEYETIELERGELLVMGPGLCHRGVGYEQRNSRLFLGFLGGLSKCASFLNTYNVFNIVTGKRKRKSSDE